MKAYYGSPTFITDYFMKAQVRVLSLRSIYAETRDLKPHFSA